MLEKLINIIFTLIFSILDLYALNVFLGSKEKLFKKKNIILLSLLTLIMFLFYRKNFSLLNILNKITIGFIINYIIFKKSFIKVFLGYIFYLLIVLFSDIIVSSALINTFELNIIRTNPIIMILSNGLVYLLTFIVLKIKFITRWLTKTIDRVPIDKEMEYVMYFILVCLIGINVLYNISLIHKINADYIVNTTILFVVILITIFYIKNSINYSNIAYKYDTLFDIMNTKEEISELKDLNNHERNNILILIKGYIENKNYDKALDQINELINTYKGDKIDNLKDLSILPKGGFQKLVYYILLDAVSKKIDVEVDVSKTSVKPLSKISYKKEVILCRIIGIYLTNAVEASIESRNKIVSLEVYSLRNDYVDIVISNTFKKKNMNENLIGKKGYTTKGKGHGKGTYLAEKTIKKNDFISHSNKIIDKFYIEHIIVKC